MDTIDWLSRLLDIMPVTGSLDIRCHYAAPWKITYDVSEAGVMRYHVVLKGRAVLEHPQGGPPRQLGAGDIVILPGGDAHSLYDGSGARAVAPVQRSGGTHAISEILGPDEPLNMICGRFKVPRPHDRVMRAYLPSRLVVNGSVPDRAGHPAIFGEQLSRLVSLMRTETDTPGLGGAAMLNALSAALFTLSLRSATGSSVGPKGVLAVAGCPRLAPALEAMIGRPGHPWTLPELAALCHVSRSTFTRRFQDKLGRPASDFLLDIRLSLAANQLEGTGASTGAVAEAIGYRSEAAFQRVFRDRMGMTPSQWRKGTRAGLVE